MRENEGSQTNTPMTVREAGRRGGLKVRAERGPAFYAEIGRKGGQKVRSTHGREYFESIGRKGGARVKELIEAGKRLSEGT